MDDERLHMAVRGTRDKAPPRLLRYEQTAVGSDYDRADGKTRQRWNRYLFCFPALPFFEAFGLRRTCSTSRPAFVSTRYSTSGLIRKVAGA